jgi:hypothetical protein
MGTKPIIWIMMSIGGTIGGYIPALWGSDSFFSFSSIFFGALGSIAGIYLGFKMSED